jgi:hypothetical protein
MSIDMIKDPRWKAGPQCPGSDIEALWMFSNIILPRWLAFSETGLRLSPEHNTRRLARGSAVDVFVVVRLWKTSKAYHSENWCAVESTKSNMADCQARP